MKNKIINIIIVLVLLVGVCVMLYPTVSNYWNSLHQTKAISDYSASVANLSETDCQSIIESAQEYNKTLSDKSSRWNMTTEEKLEYNNVLNPFANGMMGYIEIPKINVTLPIYHGTSEGVLQSGIGHVEGSSLPVGGESTHTVLSSHRGLPSAKLFTDLDKLDVGDYFVIQVLGYSLTYEVDQINIVEPGDTSKLSIIEGEDLCTLITCTPYGINTHRLLVRGHRISNLQDGVHVFADAMQLETTIVAPFVAGFVLIIILIFVLIYSRKKKARKKILKKYLG